MGALFVPVIIVLIFLVAGVAALVSMTRRRQALAEQVEQPEVPTVRHRVPPGQDPAAIIAALASAGYDAVEDPQALEVVVPCPSEGDRARIEQVISEAPRHLPGQ